jgi:thiamine-phosphate pyrophosphorylase
MTQLYAIVGSMERARLMLEARVPVLQLRFKDRPLVPHGAELRGWAARYPATRLVINDDLDAALAAGAWGVHLGQEDLGRYSAERLRAAPLKLGISTHDDAEIARAKTYRPALLGFGPVYATATKPLAHAPQGVERLREVVLGAGLPVVAIGGIKEEHLAEVARTGVDYAAMISDLDRLTTAAQVRALMERLAAAA